MSFIRPEAAATLTRWGEALIGASVLLISVYGLSVAHGVVFGFSVAGLIAGIALLIGGIRRALFPSGTGGVGVVEVDERQITYLGPTQGGAISIDDLVGVKITTTEQGPIVSDLFWQFTDADGQRLTIPGDAENVSALFDVLAVLPGADYHAVILASGSVEEAEFLVWKGAQ